MSLEKQSSILKFIKKKETPEKVEKAIERLLNEEKKE